VQDAAARLDGLPDEALLGAVLLVAGALRPDGQLAALQPDGVSRVSRPFAQPVFVRHWQGVLHWAQRSWQVQRHGR
jgi:hypothetical protein